MEPFEGLFLGIGEALVLSQPDGQVGAPYDLPVGVFGQPVDLESRGDLDGGGTLDMSPAAPVAFRLSEDEIVRHVFISPLRRR